MQAVGLHQNVSNTGGFKQHAAIGYNNKYLFHVLKSNLLQNKSTKGCKNLKARKEWFHTCLQFQEMNVKQVDFATVQAASL
ncbi:hypothetical protein IE984_22795 [Klebsiella pneumoniae]|nr:hypothetical protein [Klebsiella pneumoniae]